MGENLSELAEFDLLPKLRYSGTKQDFADDPNGRELRQALATARVFKLDPLASITVNQTAYDTYELIHAQREFALPPCPATFVQFLTRSAEDDRWTLLGLLATENRVWIFFYLPEKDYASRVGYSYRFADDAFEKLGEWKDDLDRSGEEEKYMEEYRGIIAVLRLFFLMLARGKGIRTTDKPAVRRIIKGKVRAFAAHTKIEIDLAPQELAKAIATGARGPTRAHEVRGHWVNYRRNAHCDHRWTELEPGTRRYECGSCGQLRVWRKNHYRGDSTIGFVTHEYSVTDSRKDGNEKQGKRFQLERQHDPSDQEAGLPEHSLQSRRDDQDNPPT